MLNITNNIDTYNHVHKSLENESPDFLTLAEPYTTIESPVVNLDNGEEVHLYPSKKVLALMDEIRQRNLSHEHKNAYIKQAFTEKKISKTEDTTLYFTDEQIEKVHSVFKNNDIFREGKPLADNHYIFVIDEKNRLLIDIKRITEDGRIQHTTLTRGHPVKMAGLLDVITDKISGVRSFIFQNDSGHYRPKPAALNFIINLLSRFNFKIKKEDFHKPNPDRVVRKIEFIPCQLAIEV